MRRFYCQFSIGENVICGYVKAKSKDELVYNKIIGEKWFDLKDEDVLVNLEKVDSILIKEEIPNKDSF